MPKRLPLADIWHKFTQSLSSTVVKNMSIVLYVAGLIHVPLFWKFVSRVFTYALDGKLPLPDSKISHVLLYGAYITKAANGEYLAGSHTSFGDKFEVFFVNTFFSGVVDMLLFIVILFVIFIEHEWAVREEGYTKLLLRYIGKEPRTKLADLLALMLQQGGENEAARELMINRALEDLQNLPDLHRHEAVLRRALNNGDHNDLLLNFPQLAPRDDPVPDTQNQEADPAAQVENPHGNIDGTGQGETDANGFNPHEDRVEAGEREDGEREDGEREDGEREDDDGNRERPREINGFRRLNTNVYELLGENNDGPNYRVPHEGEPEHAPSEFEHAHHGIAHRHNADDDSDSIERDPLEHHLIEEQPEQPERPRPNLNDAIEDETPEELERRRNLAEDEMAAAEAANNGDILELLGIRFNLITPIQLMILADFVVLVFLFAVYLIPHFMGNMTAMVILALWIGTYALFLRPIVRFLPVSTTRQVLLQIVHLAEQKLPFASTAIYILQEKIISPVFKLLSDLGTLDRVQPPTLVERVIFLSIGYSLVCAAVYLLMSTLVAGQKPIMGTARRIFKVLFEIVATAKVFTIFAIEIVIFPVFCGWLLDFCVTPLLVDNLYVQTEKGESLVLFFTANQDFSNLQYFQSVKWLWNPYIRPLLFWVAGTSYMFFIAMFVGMVRNHILRPGVLYFIKSPEDPNARLIHDAIVKPFLLQTLRIFLSAKVYTAFIIGGIGSVTWGLRFLVNPPVSTGKAGALLPIKFTGMMSILQALITVLLLIKAKPLIAKFCKLFWTRAFAAMCHKLRLSHFILGNPVAQERGSIVYRNFLYSVLGLEAPDYTRPVTYSEALEIFKTDDSVTALFVPDGFYVRAPSTDDNSRKFLRGLFVPVTKSDQLLQPAPEVAADEETDWWDADIVYEDSYTVVYQPPKLKLRSIALVSMICVFGALLIVTSAILAILLGRPINRAFMIILDFVYKRLGSEAALPSTNTDWSFIDINSLTMGIQLELVILLFIDNKIEGENAINLGGDQQRRLFVPPVNFRAGFFRFPIVFISSLAPALLGVHLHLNYLTAIEKYYFGTATIQFSGDSYNFNYTWHGVLLHLMLAPWTLLPWFECLSVGQSFEKPKSIIFRTVGSAVFVGLHRLFVFAQQSAGQPISEVDDIRLRIFTLVMIIFTRGAISARQFVANITEQIKNEKYVKGSAIENIDGDD